MARMPVGQVTLISVRLPSITSMPDEQQSALAQRRARVAQIRVRAPRGRWPARAPPRTMLERRSSGAGTRLTAPANSPSTRMNALVAVLHSGRKR